MALYTITTKQEFEEKVLQSQRPVLVDFWAPWCSPCRAMAPILQMIADDTAYDVVKINVEESMDNGQLAQQYGVQGIPNMRVFANGQEVNQMVGMKPKQTLVQALNDAES